MTYKITRTFHPVGQGAFYSECHNNNFNIVYDCGSIPKSHAQNVVEKTFNENDIIDILFISHFDYDHVSAISTLKETVKTIKVVVLPLLYDKHKNLLINVNILLSNPIPILTLIKEPEKFFGKETKIIYVKPANNKGNKPNNEENNPNNEKIVLNDDLPKTKKIESGAILSLGGDFKWVFIPYNHLYKERSEKLKQKLTDAGFNIGELENHSNCALNEIEKKREIIKKAYRKIEGNINENSMLLYSGPRVINKEYAEKGVCRLRCDYDCCDYDCCDYDCCDYDCCNSYICYGNSDSKSKYCIRKLGCIYTGDCDFNAINLDDVYPDVISYVGIVQIPHHGSKHNFSIDSLPSIHHKVLCPISYGTKNNYGHPAAKVVNELSMSSYKVILVNEQSDSKFVQKFTVQKI